MKNKYLLALLTFFLCSCQHSKPRASETDVVIYGGTSAAVTAAVQVKKMGKTVVIVCPEKHLGGLTASGLGWTDSGRKEVIGGLSHEFYHRIWKKYQEDDNWTWQNKEAGLKHKAFKNKDQTAWVFEPHIAEEVFEDFVKEYDIKVFRNEWLDRQHGIEKVNGQIKSITMLSGKIFKAKIFIDAGYEGDLLAAAGVSFKVGREANSTYGEGLNGFQVSSRHHQFQGIIDPFVVEGDPKSGLLPRIGKKPSSKLGDGDSGVQAYNYRTCMTNIAENRLPFPRPKNYDAKQYELLLRTLKAGSTHVFGRTMMMVNGKTDTNNHGSFSTDNIGMNHEYPEGSYARRKEILQEHEDYQKGFYYFICNDPRVPEKIQQRMKKWGLAKDEFVDNGNWPTQIYVRVARRMIGEVVMNQNHLEKIIETPKSIGMGSYSMDSHNIQRYALIDKKSGKWTVRNEGDIQVGLKAPYEISYGSIIPKKEQCLNLLVPCAVSASHIAYGSIRMEPVFMILGQSAATAACLAIDKKTAVQDVDYKNLKKILLIDNQVLTR